jgi:hypothetical protein
VAIPKESFIDAAALQIITGVMANPGAADLGTPQGAAKYAYDVAEALWAEREHRKKVENEEQETPV